MRVAYAELRPHLLDALAVAKKAYLLAERRFLSTPVAEIQRAKATYIHLVNLASLFEYFIPAVQDYGIALKVLDVPMFCEKIHNLLTVFVMLGTRGSNMYSRSLYLFLQFWQYWEDQQVPAWFRIHSFFRCLWLP